MAADPSAEGHPIVVDRVTFGYSRRASVFEDLVWSVRPGLTALLGPNGAGKTTLLSLIATIRRPSRGAIRICGHDIGSTRGRRAAQALLGFLPQRFTLVPRMRVAEAVGHACWAGGARSVDVPVLVERALADVALGGVHDKRVRELSGGQRQRLGIACAIGNRPQVLLLDEPSVGLDPAQRAEFRGLLRSLAVERTIVLSTHLVDDVVQTADHLAVIADGRLLHDSALDAVIADGPRGERQERLEATYLNLLSEGAR